MVVVGIILSALAILSVLRIGGEVICSDNGIRFVIFIGFMKIKIPGKTSEKKGKKRKKEDKVTKREKGGTAGKIKEMLPVITKALGRLRRKLRVDRIEAVYTAGGEDPAKVAVEYGAGCAFMGVLTPFLENNFNIKKRELSVQANFNEEKSSLFLDGKLTLAVWQAIYIAAGIVVPVIRRANKENSEKAVQK